MIPILYGPMETLFRNAAGEIFVDANGVAFSGTEERVDFDTLGIGPLADTISCIVTEQRNGKYELAMTYPITGVRFKDLREGCVIKATPSKGRQPDFFRIYCITKPLSGVVEVRADHISYQLSHIPVMPFTASTCAGALQGLKNNSAEVNPFTFWTDKTTLANYKQTVPASLRARLGGVQGSILDIYGGEFEFDRYDVKLYAARGADNGVQLRYGKNITDISQETNIANTVTGICPYWANDAGVVVTLPEKVVQSTHTALFPYNRTVVKDFSSDFQEQPTEDQLRARAKRYVEQNDIGIPDVSIDVSFVDLSSTADYSSIALLETVKLCDTVTVIFDPFEIRAKAKVVETVWNTLKDRYDKITLGTVKTNLAGIVAKAERAQAQALEDTQSLLANEIQHATDMITGANGGYVVINRDADGVPIELLIMDTPDIASAQRVWRWNQNGFGVSNNGYNGPYESAMTSDGHFVADFISAGILQGVEIIGEIGRIGGWTLAADMLYNTGTYDMSAWDSLTLAKIQSVLNGTHTQEWGLENGCDIDGNGVINDVDRLIVTYALLGYFTSLSGNYKAVITVQNPFNVVSVIDEATGETMAQLGMYGVSGHNGTFEHSVGVGKSDGADGVACMIKDTGITFYDSAGTLTGTYPAAGLYVGTLPGCYTDSFPTSGSSKTYDVDTGVYLVTLTRYSQAGNTGNYDSAFLVTAQNTNASHVTTLRAAPSTNGTVTISNKTITVTTSATYMRVTITMLSKI